MVILGIDPGSRVTGCGVVESRGGRLRRIAAERVRPDPRAPLPERLRVIHEAVAALITAHTPAEMAVESLFNARNAHSSLVLGHARGVILLAGAQQGLPITGYAPREVKLALTGTGSATKEQVRFMVCRWLGLAREPDSLDESDALAVALCHALRRGSPAAAGGRGRAT